MVKAEKIICNRGAAAVEAAIILPLLLLITFAVIEYGWLFLKSQQVTNAARNGVRVAIRYYAINATVDNTIDSLMASAGMGSSGYSKTYTPANISDASVGGVVTVTVSVPSANVDIVNYSLLPRPTNIRASVTMAKEGP